MNRYTFLWRELERKLPVPYEWKRGVSADQLIYGIGLVAHEFEGVHEAVLRLFSVLCGARDGQPSFKMAEILAPASSFSMKIKLCKEAAEQFEDDLLLREAIKKWLDLAERAAERRNDIIHGRMVEHHADGIVQTLLFPAAYDRRRGGVMSSSTDRLYAYTPAQVQVYAYAIGRVAGNLLTLVMRLAAVDVDEEDDWMLRPGELSR